MSLLSACGGGGSHGGVGGGSTTPVGPSTAVFADPTYVDIGPAIGDEGTVTLAVLRKQGHTAQPFTGVTAAAFNAALSGKQTLVIPDTANAPLAPALDAAARSAIAGFVNGGGTLVVHYPPSGASELLNAVFGYSLVQLDPTAPISRSAGGTAGTPYENCGPATLPVANATGGLTVASLPAGSKALYTGANGAVAVAFIPQGNGRIVVIGFDLYDANPVGVQDGGWWSVLYRSYRLRETLPSVALVYGLSNVSYRDDIVSKLKATCQFQSVSVIDAVTATPTVSQLTAYDALLVASDNPGFFDADAMGNVLADYVDTGRGVVLSMFSYNAGSLGVHGRFETASYFGIPGSVGQTQNIAETGVFNAFAGGHPVLSGVQSFSGGTGSYQPNTNLVVANVGATRLADWSDGSTPLVVTRAVGSARRVDLGFYTASSDAGGGAFWTASTDGDKLMANALTWTSKKQYEPPFQSFTNTTATPIPDPGSITSNLVVSGAPTSISKVRVTLNITHTWTSDLDIFLEAPDATMIELTTDNGVGCVNFTNTKFDDAAPTGITSISCTMQPFTASYIPEVPLAGLNGRNANGTWVLHVTDDLGVFTGTLNSWTLEVR